MNERVKSLKGQFKIESVKGKGTKINVIFNLHTLMTDQKYL
jgi:signal transduction histidine kinase